MGNIIKLMPAHKIKRLLRQAVQTQQGHAALHWYFTNHYIMLERVALIKLRAPFFFFSFYIYIW